MEEGVDCVVELVNHSRSVIVHIKSNSQTPNNFIKMFNKITDCVKEAITEFCCNVKPEIFLLDSVNEADCFNGDYMYAMSDVERIFAKPEGKEVILSISGRGKMAVSRLHMMCNMQNLGQNASKSGHQELECSRQDQQLALTSLNEHDNNVS